MLQRGRIQRIKPVRLEDALNDTDDRLAVDEILRQEILKTFERTRFDSFFIFGHIFSLGLPRTRHNEPGKNFAFPEARVYTSDNRRRKNDRLSTLWYAHRALRRGIL